MTIRTPGIAARVAFALALAVTMRVDAANARDGAGGSAATEPRPCPSVPSVHVAAADPRDVDLACDGALAAVRFFEARGLRTFGYLEVDARTALPPDVGPRAAGCWRPAEGRAVILDGATFRRRRTWFGVAIDAGMYRSVATHEVAHALAACNFAAPRPPIHAQEYVAYVVTLATMDPALRRRVLRANPGDGFATVSTIGELLYAFDTQRFGVESWRHYAKPEHGDAFLRRVLAGEALAD